MFVHLNEHLHEHAAQRKLTMETMLYSEVNDSEHVTEKRKTSWIWQKLRI